MQAQARKIDRRRISIAVRIAGIEPQDRRAR
jgi:hypothetical protein